MTIDNIYNHGSERRIIIYPSRRLRVEDAFKARLANLAIGEVRKFKKAQPLTAEAHVKFVARHSCLICGRRPSDAHHLRFAQSRALGRKVSDEYTVPLCRGHHREVHRCGDKSGWWKKFGIDPIVAARAPWLETHPLPGASDEVQPQTKNIGSTDKGYLVATDTAEQVS